MCTKTATPRYKKEIYYKKIYKVRSPVFRDTENWKNSREFGMKTEKHNISWKTPFFMPKILKYGNAVKKHKNKAKTN